MSRGRRRNKRRPPEPTHPLSVGSSVAIFRLDEARPPHIEGRAVIRSVARGPDHYRVQFIGDPILRDRIVHEPFQRDPERTLEALLDLWRAGNSLSADIADFFPDQTN